MAPLRPQRDTSPAGGAPVTLFTIVMGMSGLTLALAAGEVALGLTTVISTVACALTLAVFVLISCVYLVKLCGTPGAVRAEWNDPERLAFFPAASISLLLLAAAALETWPQGAAGMWIIGAAMQGALTLAVISGWIGTRSFLHGHLSPAWFIPAVGNVIVPIAGVPLGYPEICWFFMSVGLIFWIVLLTLVINRLIFHDPLPERLQPTLVILIAPPAVGFLGWVTLTGGIGPFARILLNVAYLFSLVVALQLPRIVRLPFSLSFWALSFPVAAVTVASLRHALLTGSGVHRVTGLALLVVLCLTMAVLAWRTLRALRARALFAR